MDVNSVMNIYSMNSIWNSINPINPSSAAVPLLDNIDSDVQEYYTSMNYFGQTDNTELQSIYQELEPNYGIQLTYDQNGNLTLPSNAALPSNELASSDSNMISLFNSTNSTTDTISENILSQYNSIETGTLRPILSSILSTNPYNVYSTIDSLGTDQGQSLNNIINTSV